MKPILFEIKPDYLFKNAIRVISFAIAVGIITYGLTMPNYYILVLSIFFLIAPVFISFRYLKIFKDHILIENKSILPFINSVKTIRFDDVEDFTYIDKESRVIKAFFSGNTKYHRPEDVQPVIDEHILLKFKNGTDFKLFKIGSSEEFKRAFDVITNKTELISLKNSLINKDNDLNEKLVELADDEVKNTKPKRKILEIKPKYQTQKVIKIILLGVGLSLGLISILFSSLSDYVYVAFLFIVGGGFYAIFSSKRYVTVYDDRIVFEDFSLIKTLCETTTILYSQIQDITFLKRQFIMFGARVPIASADDQTLYNENRIVFTIKGKKDKVIKQTGDKMEFYNAYLKLKDLIGKTNHNIL